MSSRRLGVSSAWCHQLGLQANDDADAHQQQDEGEREAGRHHYGLQGFEAAPQQQGDGDEAFENAPEHTLRNGAVILAPGRDGVDDQRAAVR